MQHIRIFRAFLAGMMCLLFISDHPIHAQWLSNGITTRLKNSFFATSKDTSRILSLIRYGSKKEMASPDDALALFRKALDYSFAIHYYKGITRSMTGIAVCYLYQGKYEKSKTTLLQEIPYANLYNTDYKTLPVLYTTLGAVYTEQGIIDSAVYYYYCALNKLTLRNILESDILIRIYVNLSAALTDLGETDRSFYYLKKAKQLALLSKDTSLLPFIYGNLCDIYLKMGNYDSSRVYFRFAALRANLRQHNYLGAQESYISMGGIQLKQNKGHSALAYFDSAMEINNTDDQNMPSLQQGLGEANYLLGNYAKALSYYKRALALCNQKGSPQDKSYIYLALAQTYKDIGQYRCLAYKYQKAYSDLSEKLMDEEKIKAINQSEVKYRLSEKDRELLQNRFQLYREQKQMEQRNIWMGVIVFSSYLLITLAFLLYNNKRKMRKIKVQQEERGRIARDLHDGMGALLSAVKMNYTVLGKHAQLSASKTYSDGMQLINDMRDELRAVAYNLVPEMMVKYTLADAVHILCDRVKNGNNIKIDIQVYGDFTALEQDLYFSIYRMLEELVNNSIKHSEASEMLVQLIRYEDKIHVTVEDNGKGFDPEKTANGMGLRNLKSRMEKLKGNLRFISQQGMGASVELEIPYKPK